MTEPQIFSVEIPVHDPQAMEQFQQAMDSYHEELNRYISELAKKMGVSQACAMDVWYLRNRSRWNQELENKLIQLHKDGNPPNLCDFS